MDEKIEKYLTYLNEDKGKAKRYFVLELNGKEKAEAKKAEAKIRKG